MNTTNALKEVKLVLFVGGGILALNAYLLNSSTILSQIYSCMYITEILKKIFETSF